MSPERHHHVKFKITPDGGIHAEFTCTAPEGASCRVWCQRSCEDSAEHTDECVLSDQGDCCQIPFLSDGDAANFPAEYFEGDPLTEIRTGPIELVWNGDWYGWKYAEDAS